MAGLRLAVRSILGCVESTLSLGRRNPTSRSNIVACRGKYVIEVACLIVAIKSVFG